MAEKNDNQPEGEEKKIPVFTVLKNGSILKNIFLLETPPQISEQKSIESGENSTKSCQESDEILVVGRHPDCNIMLEHPSISRFHLRICSQSSSQKLSVMDLLSAHGTWISGQKIEPQVPVELNEGDTLRFGASSRIYRLHWIPLSRAFDFENPFVSPLDALGHEEEEEEEEGEEEEETYEDENSMSFVKKMIPSAPPASEALNSSFSDEDSMSFVKKQISSAPPMRESMNSSFSEEEDEAEEEVQSAVEILQDVENQNPSRRILEAFITESVNSSVPVEGVLSEATEQHLEKENQSPQVFSATEVLSERENQEFPLKRSESHTPGLWSRRGKPTNVLQIQTSRSRGKNVGVGINVGKEAQDQEEIKASSRVLFSGLDGEEEIFTPDKENFSPNTIWSRRGKPANVLQIQTSRSRGKNVGIGTKVGMEPDNQKEVIQASSRVLFSGLDREEENFTPNKENFSPSTLLLKSMKKLKVEEIKHSKLHRSSSKITTGSKIDPEEDMFSSLDKENETSKVLQEMKPERTDLQNRPRLESGMITKRRAERLPFHSLQENSISKNWSEVSVPNVATRSSNSVNCGQTIQKNSNPSSKQLLGEAKRRWNIVVDTTSLLNKESRRSLKLLQGIKGTQLIIPRMVIRELDCLKRRGNLFRRATKVSSVLQWIEECMVKTKWWIHVQSSVEEGMPVAPTPSASPRSRSEGSNGGFASGSTNSVPFSSFGSLMEIVSPTSEDHILECALLFKRINNDGQLILLTNDVTLKIKAMAEGLLCETAEEFRESLVNPYSERFMWAESAPRGPTWSCMDDIVLKENYYLCPIKKTSKTESVKGLKLILHHYHEVTGAAQILTTTKDLTVLENM